MSWSYAWPAFPQRTPQEMEYVKFHTKDPECLHVVLSQRAYTAIIAETLRNGKNETGGVFIGNIFRRIWYVVDAIEPGIHTQHEVADFVWETDYVNYLASSLSGRYKHPLSILGFWHRHPGDMDYFSGVDVATIQKNLREAPHGLLSMLVNLDPDLRMTFYYCRNNTLMKVNYDWGDEYFIPDLLEYASPEELIARSPRNAGLRVKYERTMRPEQLPKSLRKTMGASSHPIRTASSSSVVTTQTQAAGATAQPTVRGITTETAGATAQPTVRVIITETTGVTGAPGATTQQSVRGITEPSQTEGTAAQTQTTGTTAQQTVLGITGPSQTEGTAAQTQTTGTTAQQTVLGITEPSQTEGTAAQTDDVRTTPQPMNVEETAAGGATVRNSAPSPEREMVKQAFADMMKEFSSGFVDEISASLSKSAGTMEKRCSETLNQFASKLEAIKSEMIKNDTSVGWQLDKICRQLEEIRAESRNPANVPNGTPVGTAPDGTQSGSGDANSQNQP